MKIPEKDRQLVPAFRLKGKVFVWACSHCRRLFFADIEETESRHIARHVALAFGCHFCTVPQLTVAARSDCEVVEISSWPNVEPVVDKGNDRE